MGFALTYNVSIAAVSSYLTFSPLLSWQRYISVALSVGFPRPAVNGHLSGRARTFLWKITSSSGRPATSTFEI